MSEKSENIILPGWAVFLVSRDGYMARYYSYRALGYNSRKAYEVTETELSKYFGVIRYSSFESFQTSMRRWHKKKTCTKTEKQ